MLKTDIKLIINGEDKFFEKELSINEIIESLLITNKVMATAVNTHIIKKDKWNEFYPKDNDRIEFLQFVGGG